MSAVTERDTRVRPHPSAQVENFHNKKDPSKNFLPESLSSCLVGWGLGVLSRATVENEWGHPSYEKIHIKKEPTAQKIIIKIIDPCTPIISSIQPWL
ncbi:MAG: hypothetical protein OSJ44_16415, partial [Lachnospiraceae bacterium]|nr:hypothetical protein [Lachnospiraceae bacterium]